VNTSGSASGHEYSRYLMDVRSHYQDSPIVVNWANTSLDAGDKLQAVQTRSTRVQARLTQLDPSLGQLHRQARDASLIAKATNQEIVEATAILDRVLERFLGQLWALANARGKANYKVLSAKLAANVPLTRKAVEDGQATYDRINQELMRIRKSMTPATGARVVELLREMEVHVEIITGALDPTLTGITFSS
jgi:hypothetical protein